MKSYKIVFLLCILILGCKEVPENKEIEDTELNEMEHQDSISENGMDTNEPVVDSVELNAIKSQAETKKLLAEQGYQLFDYIDPKSGDTILMQQYFIAFLKKGPVRNQNEEEAAKLQEEHLAHLSKMYEMGYADISGPMGDDGDIRGITIYNVPTLKMADSLANADPMVKARRLIIEMHPWWAAKGTPLR